MAIYTIPGRVETIRDLAIRQQTAIAECSGDDVLGYDTAINSLIAAFQTYGQVA